LKAASPLSGSIGGRRFQASALPLDILVIR